MSAPPSSRARPAAFHVTDFSSPRKGARPDGGTLRPGPKPKPEPEPAVLLRARWARRGSADRAGRRTDTGGGCPLPSLQARCGSTDGGEDHHSHLGAPDLFRGGANRLRGDRSLNRLPAPRWRARTLGNVVPAHATRGCGDGRRSGGGGGGRWLGAVGRRATHAARDRGAGGPTGAA